MCRHSWSYGGGGRHGTWSRRGGDVHEAASWLPTVVFVLGLFPQRILFSHPVDSFFLRYSYSDELPSRFKKHVIKAVQDDASQGSIKMESLNQILDNIGRSDAKLSAADQQLVLNEAGASSADSIPVSKMIQML